MVLMVIENVVINQYKQIFFINKEVKLIQHLINLNYILYNDQDDMVQTSFLIFFINHDDFINQMFYS